MDRTWLFVRERWIKAFNFYFPTSLSLQQQSSRSSIPPPFGEKGHLTLCRQCSLKRCYSTKCIYIYQKFVYRPYAIGITAEGEIPSMFLYNQLVPQDMSASSMSLIATFHVSRSGARQEHQKSSIFAKI